MRRARDAMQAELVARLYGGDIATAVEVFKELPLRVMRDVGPETIADAFALAFTNVEMAAKPEAPNDLEHLARFIRRDVTAMVKRARNWERPEDLIVVYLAVALTRAVLEQQQSGEGEET